MSWSFDETNDRVTVTDASVLTLPNADWCIGGWFRAANGNTGSVYKYMFSWSSFGANPSLQIFLDEASEATNGANKLSCLLNGSDLGANTIVSTATPGADTNWHHAIVQRAGSTVTMYVDGSSQADTLTSVAAGCNVAADFYIGGRSDANVDRFFGGHLAEWFKLDRSLSAREIASIARGVSPASLPGIYDATSWYLPMQSARYIEWKDRLALSNSGSTTARHPPVRMAENRIQQTFRNPVAPSGAVFNPITGRPFSDPIFGGPIAF